MISFKFYDIVIRVYEYSIFNCEFCQSGYCYVSINYPFGLDICKKCFFDKKRLSKNGLVEEICSCCEQTKNCFAGFYFYNSSSNPPDKKVYVICEDCIDYIVKYVDNLEFI